MGSYTDGLRLMVILFLSLFFALPYSLEEASLLQTPPSYRPLPRIKPVHQCPRSLHWSPARVKMGGAFR